MAPTSGDRFVIRIGGDAHGPVVAGNDNRVEILEATVDPRAADPGTDDAGVDDPGTADATTSGEAAPPVAAAPTQTNTASGHGTVYTVMEGDMHIHHEAPAPADDAG